MEEDESFKVSDVSMYHFLEQRSGCQIGSCYFSSSPNTLDPLLALAFPQVTDSQMIILRHHLSHSFLIDAFVPAQPGAGPRRSHRISEMVPEPDTDHPALGWAEGGLWGEVGWGVQSKVREHGL